MSDRIDIVAVLVLYQRTLDQSNTWQSLRHQVDPQLLAAVDFHLIICDNAPAQPLSQPLPAWAEYFAADRNSGIAWAYNRGLAVAEERGATWLITLDQDTDLPLNYLQQLAGSARLLQAEPGLAAIVPRLVDVHGRVYSPFFVNAGREQPVSASGTGYLEGEVRAYNSAAMLRVASLRAIGGYDRRFYLDFLDHATFHALHCHGYRFWIEGSLNIPHRLSLHSDRERMTRERFHNFSFTESAFRDLYASPWEGILFSFRLLLRAINQTRRGDPAHFRQSTLDILKLRLLRSRQERIHRWEAAVVPMFAEPQITAHVHGASLEVQS